MNPFMFQTSSNLLFVPGAARRLLESVARYNARRAPLVTDRDLRSAVLTRTAEVTLASAGCEFIVFEDVATPLSTFIKSIPI